MKKYCECFKAGEGCKEGCRCLNCLNKKIVEIVPDKHSYIIENTSIYVNRDDIIIHKSQYNQQEMNMLNKKREREDDNMVISPLNVDLIRKTRDMNVDRPIKN
jgi:hypothetical protein